MKSVRKKAFSVNNLALTKAGPFYTKCGPKCGGSYSRVILGPRKELQKNSNANPDLPKGIKQAKLDFPKEKFIAGHLVNETFGGDGQNEDNLVILTEKANSACKGFDENIKTALLQFEHLFGLLGESFVDIKRINALYLSKRPWTLRGCLGTGAA